MRPFFWRNRRRRPASLRQPVAWEVSDLEPRVMLAGDAGAVVADAVAAPSAEVAEVIPGPAVNETADAAAERVDGSAIVFIDAAVSDFEALADGVTENAEVVLLDADQDGMAQISRALARRCNVRAIHLVTHGQAGGIEVAGKLIDAASLRENADFIRGWSAALAPGADILIYGCHTGEGEAGGGFIRQLAQLTGADVAASTDATGNREQDGDWDLERQFGSIEASLVFDTQVLQSYDATLPISIRAAGATGQEEMQLQIDGVAVQTWSNVGGDIETRQFQTFTYDGPSDVAANQVRVAFTNDQFIEGELDRNLAVDRISINGQTIQTEGPEVFSTGFWKPGEGITSGFLGNEILHANGYFQYGPDEPNPDGSLIKIRAAGESGEERMELRIDGEVVQEWNNVGGDPATGQFLEYRFQASETVTADRIQVVFTNDRYEEGVLDRNLYVDNIEVDGTIFETEAPTVFSTGTWGGEDGVQPGFRQSEVLHANGYFQYDADASEPGETLVTIYAAGSTNTEQMQLQVDGTPVQTWNNIGGNEADGQFVPYTYRLRQEVSADQIRVAFTNDLFDNGFDRNLRVDRIELDGVTFQTEAPTVFSTGTWVPGAGISSGFLESEYLHSDGYFQYEAGDRSPGVIALETSILNAEETAGAVAIRVQRTQGSDGRVTVDYSTIDATAKAGDDFIGQAGTLVFEDGDTVQTVTVPITDDAIAEGNESFNFAIDNVTGGATLLAPRTATITIADDDITLPDYADFADGAALTLNGDAQLRGGQLLLTEAARAEEGAAFFNTPLPINADTSFQTRFEFQLDGGQQSLGADGFAFVLQDDPRGVNAIGEGGGRLGYEGMMNSLAVEFDTYKNGYDVNNNHVSVLLNGDVTTALETKVPLFDLNNADVLTAWVDYNGNTDQLAVFVNNEGLKPDQPLLVADIDLSSVVGTSGYLGFTAATGGSFNNHRILNWDLSLETPATIQPPTPGTTLVAETVVEGLTQPTDVAWSPDGANLYISEKSGLVKVVRNGAAEPTEFIDIRDQVNGTRDRGLLDIALHPDFENNPYVYLLFTYDPPEVFENVGDPLAGPDQKGNRAGRLIRVTADADTDFTTAIAGSEVVLLGTNSTWDNFNGFVNSTVDFDEPPAGYNPDGTNIRDFINSDSESHTVGSLAFGVDGNLFVSTGDGASYNRVDPRAVRVQDIDNLSGKILRIDPLTGEGLPDNPFFNGDAGANRSKVYQFGLRNPYRIATDPESGQLFIGDVGWSQWEEINTGEPGANFGWPYFEGGSGTNIRANGYQNLPEAIAFYASGATATPATFGLNHGADGINAIILGAVYTGDVYPAEFQGDVFFNDLGQGLVRNANLDADGNVISAQNFATGAGIVVSIQQGPDGTLHYVDLDDGLVGRWFFA